jgi:quinol monooxygenase YgiN
LRRFPHDAKWWSDKNEGVGRISRGGVERQAEAEGCLSFDLGQEIEEQILIYLKEHFNKHMTD